MSVPPKCVRCENRITGQAWTHRHLGWRLCGACAQLAQPGDVTPATDSQ